MTDRRGPSSDAPYDTADTTPGDGNRLADTGASGAPSSHAIPDDGRDAGINGADLVSSGDQPATDAPTLAGDAVGAAAGSALEDDEQGPDSDAENEVSNQQRPF